MGLGWRAVVGFILRTRGYASFLHPPNEIGKSPAHALGSRHLEDRFGGNGGLSLRRVAPVLQILSFQSRLPNSAPEDQWLSSRIGLLPGANMAPPHVEREFAVQDTWYDSPMGYHINPNLGPGSSPDVWDNVEKRTKVYGYCPEVKVVLDMRLERERCPEVLQVWGPVVDEVKDYIIPDPGAAGDEDRTGARDA